MIEIPERVVHAWGVIDGTRVEVVRYNRAGRWHSESAEISIRVSIQDAADIAVRLWREGNGTVCFDRPGGAAFNRLVRLLVP